MSTRYAALGVDIQMRQHNIIAVIVQWPIPEKKKMYNFPQVPTSPRLVHAAW